MLQGSCINTGRARLSLVSLAAVYWMGALRDIQKTAARKTRLSFDALENKPT